jgi:hypothetical protein
MNRRGRKPKPEDEQLLAALEEALDNQPPASLVDRWKEVVRRAMAKKRGKQ